MEIGAGRAGHAKRKSWRAMENVTMQDSNFVANVGLTEMDGEPRARDLDIADRLGFSQQRDIRKLIERHKAELQAFGVCATVAQTSGPKGGRPATEYWLNEEQALLVSILSDAPNAPANRLSSRSKRGNSTVAISQRLGPTAKRVKCSPCRSGNFSSGSTRSIRTRWRLQSARR
jgi:hypothetical protein